MLFAMSSGAEIPRCMGHVAIFDRGRRRCVSVLGRLYRPRLNKFDCCITRRSVGPQNLHRPLFPCICTLFWCETKGFVSHAVSDGETHVSVGHDTP